MTGEACDPPSSFPTGCDDANACTQDTMTGSAAGCTLACQHTPISVCQTGDGCCPLGCNANNDSDCAPSCGNGAVEAGETCAPPSSCPSACSDGNACTVDMLTGGAANCSAACSHTPYTCVDALECTSDICNGDGTCTFAINPGNCVAKIEGTLKGGGVTPPDRFAMVSWNDAAPSLSLTRGEGWGRAWGWGKSVSPGAAGQKSCDVSVVEPPGRQGATRAQTRRL